MARQHLIHIVLVGLVFASGTAAAASAIYKWVDQSGVTQYTQTPPPKNAKNSQTVRVSTHVPVDVREGRPQGMVDAQTLQAYTSPAQNAAAGSTPTPESDTETSNTTSENPVEVARPSAGLPRVGAPENRY